MIFERNVRIKQKNKDRLIKKNGMGKNLQNNNY